MYGQAGIFMDPCPTTKSLHSPTFIQIQGYFTNVGCQKYLFLLINIKYFLINIIKYFFTSLNGLCLYLLNHFYECKHFSRLGH